MRAWLFLASLACSNGSGGAPNGGDAADAGKPLAPIALRGLETDAEGVSDACKVVDWTKAQGVLAEAMTNWSSLKTQVAAAGAPAAMLTQMDSNLATLSSDVTGQSQKACETDANVITLAVPDLFDFFTWPVPSDALRGDGVFRQLQIDGEYADWTRTAADMNTTTTLWTRLKPLAQNQAPTRPDIVGSATVVKDMDTAVQQCQTASSASDAATLQTCAQTGLDAIDVIEQIFN